MGENDCPALFTLYEIIATSYSRLFEKMNTFTTQNQANSAMKAFPLLIIFVLLFSESLYSQCEKGDIWLGGSSNINFSYTNSYWNTDYDSGDGNSAFAINFEPQVGMFVATGFVMGIGLPITFEKENNISGGYFQGSSISFALLLRYYFGSNIVKPYLHANAAIGTEKYEYLSNGSTNDGSGLILPVEAGGGIAIFLNKFTAIEIGLDLQSTYYRPSDNEYGYSANRNKIALNIGVIAVL